MDFSINAGTFRAVSSAFHLLTLLPSPVQAVDRALVVDVLPTGLQPAGNAWAATMLGVGSVFGFFVFVSFNTAPISPAKYRVTGEKSISRTSSHG